MQHPELVCDRRASKNRQMRANPYRLTTTAWECSARAYHAREMRANKSGLLLLLFQERSRRRLTAQVSTTPRAFPQLASLRNMPNVLRLHRRDAPPFRTPASRTSNTVACANTTAASGQQATFDASYAGNKLMLEQMPCGIMLMPLHPRKLAGYCFGPLTLLIMVNPSTSTYAGSNRQNSLRVATNLSSRIKLIWPVQTTSKKYSDFLSTQITSLFPPSHPPRGGVSRSSRTLG